MCLATFDNGAENCFVVTAVMCGYTRTNIRNQLFITFLQPLFLRADIFDKSGFDDART